MSNKVVEVVEVVVSGTRNDEVVVDECGRVDPVVAGATEPSVAQALVSKNRNMTMPLQKAFRGPERLMDLVWRDRLVIMAQSLCLLAGSAESLNSHLQFMFRK